MSKICTKQHFLDNLKFRLQFYFNNKEINDILTDYEEWFENESSAGKTEEEICAKLGSTQQIIGKILSSESMEDTNFLLSFFRHPAIQITLLSIGRFLLEFLILQICNHNAINFVYVSFILNIIYFFLGIHIVKSAEEKISFPFKIGFPLITFAAFIALALVIPQITYSQSAVFHMLLFVIFETLLLVIHFSLCLFKFFKNRTNTFMPVFYTAGSLSAILFINNQMHMLYPDTSSNIKLLIGVIILNMELLFLNLLYKKMILKR